MQLPLLPTSDRDRLIVEHIALPHQIASSRCRHSDPAFEDMKADGYAGLVAAAAKYDPTRGVSFKTFAWHHIQGAILDGGRRLTGRGLKPRFEPYDDCHSAGAQSPEAPALEDSIDRLRSMARLREQLLRLPEREQQIARSHYFSGKTIQETARDIGCSEFTASRIHARMIRQLRETLATAETP